MKAYLTHFIFNQSVTVNERLKLIRQQREYIHWEWTQKYTSDCERMYLRRDHSLYCDEWIFPIKAYVCKIMLNVFIILTFLLVLLCYSYWLTNFNNEKNFFLSQLCLQISNTDTKKMFSIIFNQSFQYVLIGTYVLFYVSIYLYTLYYKLKTAVPREHFAPSLVVKS